jgi:hypothetical protein
MGENGSNDVTQDKIKQLSVKLMELGNLCAAGLAFGQSFSDKGFDSEVALVGLGLTIWLYAIAWFIRSESDKGR